MENNLSSPYEWNIKTNIGPIIFNVFIDSSFFNFNKLQYSPRHRHATFEFHFITDGSGTIYTDDSQYEVVPSSYYIVEAGIYHMQKGSVSDPLHRYSCKFEYDIGNSAIDGYSEEEIKSFVQLLSNVKFFYSRNLHQLMNIVLEIQSELLYEAIGYYAKVQHLFSLLFINIIREIAIENKYKMKMPSQKMYPENRIRIIENFFEINYHYKATSQDLCKLVHISKSQLNRILKEIYNMTFKQKHIEVQIERIKDMLANTDLPIGTIAERMGYASESNFIAFFKHETGISPKGYRKQKLL